MIKNLVLCFAVCIFAASSVLGCKTVSTVSSGGSDSAPAATPGVVGTWSGHMEKGSGMTDEQLQKANQYVSQVEIHLFADNTFVMKNAGQSLAGNYQLKNNAVTLYAKSFNGKSADEIKKELKKNPKTAGMAATVDAPRTFSLNAAQTEMRISASKGPANLVFTKK